MPHCHLYCHVYTWTGKSA